MKRLALLLAAVLLTGRAVPASVPASSNIPEQTAETSSLLYWTPYTSIPNESGYFSVFHSADGTPLLSRYDFTEMTRHIVCDVPGCTHADSTCPAYLADSAIVCVPDAVYTFLQQLDEHGTPSGLSTMMRRDPDGTVTEYDLSTGETRVRTTGLCAAVQQGNPPVELTSVADGYLLATVRAERQGEQWFLISPDGDCQPFSLPVEERDFADALGATDVSMPKIVQPVCETSRGLLVQHARQYFFKQSHASDGTPVTFETFATRYALMDPEDYLASRPVYREFTEISQQ